MHADPPAWIFPVQACDFQDTRTSFSKPQQLWRHLEVPLQYMAACRLRGFKSDLVKDLYKVQSVTKSSQTKNPVHGLINARVITLYLLDTVWQQKQKRRETKSQGHTQEVSEATKAPCGNQGSPQPGSPRSHGARPSGITAHI